MFERFLRSFAIAGLLVVAFIPQGMAQLEDLKFCNSFKFGGPKNCVAYDSNGEPYRANCPQDVARYERVCKPTGNQTVNANSKSITGFLGNYKFSCSPSRGDNVVEIIINIIGRHEIPVSRLKIGEEWKVRLPRPSYEFAAKVALNENGEHVFKLNKSIDDVEFWRNLRENSEAQQNRIHVKREPFKTTIRLGNSNWESNGTQEFLDSCKKPAEVAQTKPKTPEPQNAVPIAPVAPSVPSAPSTQPVAGLPNSAQNKDSDGLNIAEGVALGLLAIGTAVAVDQISDTFFTEEPAPAAPSNGQGRTINVQITSVRAVETTFGFGGDEIFLLASNGQRFPANENDAQDIDEGQTWNPNASLSAAGGVSIDLREWDSFNASDQIGNFTIDANHQEGSFTTTLRGDGAVYEIGYNVGFGGQTQQVAQPVQNTQPAQRPTQQVQPTAPQRVWGVDGVYEQIVATDCRDCGEDTGIIIACQGDGLAALASVPWIAIENGFNGSVLPINITIGNQRFTYTSTLNEWGMVGFVPEFVISPNDAIVEALQSGSAARFDFEGHSVSIGLKGSRDALDIFKAHCGWNNVAVPQSVNDNVPQPIWYASSYEDYDTGRQVTDLTFGIPETDAIGFHARCEADGSVLTSLQVDYGNRIEGAPVDAFIQADQQAYGYKGKVFIDASGEWAGIGIRMSSKDPIWQAIKSSQQVTYGIIGGAQNTASSTGVVEAIDQFIGNCLPQHAAVPKPSPTSGGMQQTVNYQCDDGSNMSIELSTAGSVSFANIVRDSGSQYALVKVPTSVGTKYSNGEATLNTSGNTAQLMASGNAIFCEAK